MPSHIVSTEIIFRAAWCMLGLCGPPDAVGVGAYYMPGVMQGVCEHRVEQGWTPGLQCDWYCLVSGIEHNSLGEWWAVDVPGASFHL